MAGLTLLLGILVSLQFGILDTERQQSIARSQVTQDLAAIRARLEGIINTVFSATLGLSEVIAHQGGIAPDLFEALARQVIKGHPQIRNIVAAPDNVITLLYPLDGNRQALGLDYSTIPEQYAAVQKAMQTGSPVFSGPHNLVQGGRGIIAREPVFTSQGVPRGTAPRYWGVVSVVTDIDALLDAGGMRSSATLTIGLRKNDEHGNAGTLILGTEAHFTGQPVRMEVSIPGGSWQIAAVPKEGWPQLTATASLFFYIGLVNSLLAAAIIWWLVARPYQVRLRNQKLRQEITDRIRAEEELRLSEQKYSAIFHLMPDIVGITRMVDGCFLEVNTGFARMTGWEEHELLGRTSVEIGLWTAEARAEGIAIIREKGWLENYEFILKTKSGEQRNALMFMTPIKVKNEDCIYFMVRDITELQKAQRVLENERIRFINLVDSVDGVVWETDTATFTFTYVSKQAERLLGYPVEAWYETGFWQQHLHPDDREKVLAYATACTARGEDHNLEYRFLAKDGRIFWVQDIVTVVAENGLPRWRRGIMVDTTRRKEEEKEKRNLEIQLRQAQKMEAVGRLAGGVAHDFNNKLSVILGYADLAKDGNAPPDKIRGYLNQIIKASTQSRDITRQLLAFSRQEVISPRVLNLNTMVKSVQKGLGRFIREDIRFEVSLAEGLWPINMDPTQVDQVIMNLIVNARDAMADGGRLEVETKNISLDAAFTHEHPEILQEGDYVQLTVSDTGCGMSPETLQHAFEPFYTTKETGKGTGLGLATVYGIVTQNKGLVLAESTLGTGSTFKVFFPRCREEERQEVVEERAEPVQARSSATILLVEDEETVRQMTTDILEQSGYIALVATTPQEAMAICARKEQQIDLLLTDVIMPEMNGRELSRQIEFIRPGIKVLFMSGYAADIIPEAEVTGAGTPFIQKPFNVQTLLNKIEKQLQGHGKQGAS
jgi:PAS domain S-box-containing protein